MKIDRWRLQQCVGKGSFGKVYKAIDCIRNEPVAIKFERRDAEYPQLQYEHRVYKLLEDVGGVPRVYGPIGDHRNYIYFAMDYYDTDLQKMFSRNKYSFERRFVNHIISSIVETLRQMHEHGIIHRDLKPGNMMYNPKTKQVFLVDMGLSKRYIDPVTKQHIQYITNKSLCGTPRFASRNCHLGVQLSRRDDIESLAYIAVYLMKGRLPWMSRGKLTNREIERMKIKTSSKSLTKGLGENMYKFVKYSRHLKFAEKPDYGFLLSLMKPK